MKKVSRLLTSFVMMVTLAACVYLPTVHYSQFVSIPAEGMPKDWQFTFSPADSIDSIARQIPVNVIVAVRYAGRCRARNIVLNVEEMALDFEHPDSSAISLQLFTDDGRPLGRGVYGVYEISDTLRRNFIIPEGYFISISSPLPTDMTRGINDLGIVVGNPPEGPDLWSHMSESALRIISVK